MSDTRPHSPKVATRNLEGKARSPQPDKADEALQETYPNWDRMGEIADRLLSTPPDRQAVGKALAPKRAKGAPAD